MYEIDNHNFKELQMNELKFVRTFVLTLLNPQGQVYNLRIHQILTKNKDIECGRA